MISKHRLWWVLALVVALTLCCGVYYGCRTMRPRSTNALASENISEPQMKPLTEDEQAALRWLDHIMGPLSAAEEKDWWNIGGRQFGLFSTRYNIAFAGYSAAALGIRGNAEQKATVARILDNAIVRYLKKEVWAYSQAKSYWGTKPWAPDPCYRENIMYTGHLLQLLALYEAFSGDRKYWEAGFDFVWDSKKNVHYDVQKLIDVTVEQMRANDSGGVTCEPGLLFFPCNNHQNYALKIFAQLGHGDWTADSRRWEKWALSHYNNPLLGGGVFNLLYHTGTGLFYPRGYSGLDAWSLIWYEPWAEDRATPIALWDKAKTMLDWEKLSDPTDTIEGANNCMNPQQVPATVLCVFLASASRVCDDPDTAERLEKAIDAKYLRRQDGMYWLNVGREWRIGATANRILSLALENGSRFREWTVTLNK